MKITGTLKIAVRNLLKNKMRSLLTSLGIIIGVGSVVIMTAIGTGSQNEITIALRQSHKLKDGQDDDFNVGNQSEITEAATSTAATLTLLLGSIAGVSLLVRGIGIMNIMLVTVTERTKEIGLLKAIGATRKDILTQFLIESVILTVTGGAIGIGLGVGIGYLIAQGVHVPFGLPIIPVIASVSVSVVIGILFGSYPAYRASKLSPIDALHYE